MPRNRDPNRLILTEQVQLDIITEVRRLFALHNVKLSFHFEESYIQVMILPKSGARFESVDGPADYRVEGSNDIQRIRRSYGF